MSLVGNDVVDLDDPAVATSHLRERFVARVCHPSERAMLSRSPSPKALLWSLFAAKEAAYKVVCKLGPAPVFAHRQFVVAEHLRAVRYQQHWLALKVRVEGSCVHAVAWLGEEPLDWAVTPVPEGHSSSLVARRALLERLGDEGLEVFRPPRPGSWDGYAPPRLLRRGQPQPFDISLSHDGRFAAFALTTAPA